MLPRCARWLPTLSLVLIILGLVVTHAAERLAPGTLCQEQEQVIFSCPVLRGKKLVSLCASPVLTAQQGYLQYRFGRPDSVELTFPSQQRETQQQFFYAYYSRYQVSRTTIRFGNADSTYTVFDAYEGDTALPERQQGVTVRLSGGKEHTLACQKPGRSALASLRPVLPCDQTSPLIMESCQ